MNDILFEINGIKYLKFNGVCKTKSQAENIQGHVKKYNGIIRAFDVSEGFWSGTKVNFEVLIPEEKAILFSREKS